MQGSWTTGLSIRAAVFLGFGLIFGLWLFAWFELSLQISGARNRATATNARYMSAQDTFSEIRTEVLTSSVAFRDALLDQDPRHTSLYRHQLERSHSAVDELLKKYVPFSDSASEREQLKRLREELDELRGAMVDVLESDSSRWLSEARDVLSLRVTPRRDVVLAVSEGLQALNRSAYVQQQAELADIYRVVQRELWQLLGLALAIGIAVAVLAIAYASRLESRLRRQMAKDADLTRDLQGLSARLITVQEEERRHIARELHDEIGQALTAVKVELACAQRSMEEKAGPTRVLQDARAITDTAIHQVRDLSYLLHPAALDEFGLVAAVDSYLRSFGKRYNLAVSLRHDCMEARLSQDTEAAAYRIIQEALTNVAKHARARTCRVHLALCADVLKIRIEDDGRGFNTTAARSVDRKGLGLIGIRERASHLAGHANIVSAVGKGTCVLIELPARVRVEETDYGLAPDPGTVLREAT